jgi:hypothetical protein
MILTYCTLQLLAFRIHYSTVRGNTCIKVPPLFAYTLHQGFNVNLQPSTAKPSSQTQRHHSPRASHPSSHLTEPTASLASSRQHRTWQAPKHVCRHLPRTFLPPSVAPRKGKYAQDCRAREGKWSRASSGRATRTPQLPRFPACFKLHGLTEARSRNPRRTHALNPRPGATGSSSPAGHDADGDDDGDGRDVMVLCWMGVHVQCLVQHTAQHSTLQRCKGGGRYYSQWNECCYSTLASALRTALTTTITALLTPPGDEIRGFALVRWGHYSTTYARRYLRLCARH